MQKKKGPTSAFLTKEAALQERKWILLDGSGKILGRFASEVAKILRGKHKPNYTPHVDCGDGVIIINADKIRVTGSKGSRKIYRYYTGSMSGLREVPYNVMISRNPQYVVEHAVKGMMPKSRLGKQQAKKLRVFVGTQHDLGSQQPIQVMV